MDAVRIGRVVRALRLRRRWRQADLAARVGVSQSLVARVERGGANRLRLDTLDRIVAALDSRLVVRVDWQGEGADRLLDQAHADLVEQVLMFLRAADWEVIPEVTFNAWGERGSIDILGWHEGSATVLVVEVKSVVPDVQSMLSAFDRKIRLADGVARVRGWRPARIWSLLAIREGRTSRRRIEEHGATFAARFPDRADVARRLLRAPREAGAGAPALRALWFLSPRTRATRGHRIVTDSRSPGA